MLNLTKMKMETMKKDPQEEVGAMLLKTLLKSSTNVHSLAIRCGFQERLRTSAFNLWEVEHHSSFTMMRETLQELSQEIQRVT